VACVGKNNGKPAALLDGVLGPGYDQISPYISWDAGVGEGSPVNPYGFTFSPDSRHFAYSARRGRKWLVVLDGVEQAHYDFVGQLLFSPDSQHLAYSAMEGEKWFVVLDGARHSESYPAIANLTVSADGRRLGYVACEERSCAVWIDDKDRGAFATVGEIELGQDSQSFAFTAANYTLGEYRIYVITDQQTWEVSAGPLRTTVYGGFPVARSSQAQIANFLAKYLPILILSPDGKHIIWVELGKLVRDGKPGPPCERISAAGFSADGNRLAVICASQLKMSLLVDDQVLREFDPQVEYPHFPTFSPDGKRFAYAIARPLVSSGKTGKLRDYSDSIAPGTTSRTDYLNSLQAFLSPANQKRGF
jgi:WD40 repeat protein